MHANSYKAYIILNIKHDIPDMYYWSITHQPMLKHKPSFTVVSQFMELLFSDVGFKYANNHGSYPIYCCCKTLEHTP